MSSPRNGDWAALKRVARYLLGRPRLVWRFKWQEPPKFVSAFSDSNWAGCHDTRKSTTGACIMHGSHLVKAFSRTQGGLGGSERRVLRETATGPAAAARREGMGGLSFFSEDMHNMYLSACAEADELHNAACDADQYGP